MTGTRQSFQECSPYSRLVTVYNVRTRCFETILIRHLYGETVPMKSGVCADIVMSERPYISFTIGHETTNQGKGGGGGIGVEVSAQKTVPITRNHAVLIISPSFVVAATLCVAGNFAASSYNYYLENTESFATVYAKDWRTSIDLNW
ncbi:hypothetical protein PISMIDRAFT_334964 [Pisolithus microcarpus 441]|uniref:Uncharacterized protein n=1 Tax=Pisolithus microcarpus 441 TaxID=765257 RepID=A0A0D0A0V2_9AGAM|nr:hypothetical protein PISMIDRAFT_334964 [Pisolithus microcarpus 441]